MGDQEDDLREAWWYVSMGGVALGRREPHLDIGFSKHFQGNRRLVNGVAARKRVWRGHVSECWQESTTRSHYHSPIHEQEDGRLQDLWAKPALCNEVAAPLDPSSFCDITIWTG